MTNVCSWRPTLVTLHDGTQVASDSEEWRHECEAMAIINLSSIAQRRDFLAKIEAKRGKDAAERLKYTIKQIWYAPK